MNIYFDGKSANKVAKSKSTIVNNNTINVNYFSKTDKVNDEKRGLLYYDNLNQTWVFCGLQQKSVKNCYNLVLLLESPHKDEYDSCGNPLRPANGTTGTKIQKLFAKQVNNNNAKWKLEEGKIYCVWLVNAIQYQTSAFNQLNNQSNYNKQWRSVRNYIFKTLWKNEQLFNLQADLTKRINTIKPKITINCVTGGKSASGLRTMVNKSISQQWTTFCYSHPSSWK